MTFRVYGIPQTKGSTKGFAIRNKATGKTRVIITNDNLNNKSWAQTVSGEAQRYRPAYPFTGPVSLTLAFFMKKPKSYPKTRELYAVKKPDIDKMCRSILDSLKGVFYLDDSQVVSLNATKAYDNAPGVEIDCKELVDA